MNKTCENESCMNGYLLVPNHQHDVMERVECMECLVNENTDLTYHAGPRNAP